MRQPMEMTEKYEHCIKCPTDFCPWLSEFWFLNKNSFSPFFLCLLVILEISR